VDPINQSFSGTLHPKNGLQAPFSYNFATIVSKWLASIGLKKYDPPFFLLLESIQIVTILYFISLNEPPISQNPHVSKYNFSTLVLLYNDSFRLTSGLCCYTAYNNVGLYRSHGL
jgi:hypothetical protein